MGRSPLSDEELHLVLDTMVNESHRGCVLVGVALIEWKLEQVITVALTARHEARKVALVEKEIKIMLDPLHEKSVLGSAAARARMCRVLNLISDHTHKALKELFRFRNQHFAHFRGRAKLTNARIKKDLESLNDRVPYGKTPLVKFDHGKLDHEHLMFVRIIIYLFLRLEQGAELARRDPSLPHQAPS